MEDDPLRLWAGAISLGSGQIDGCGNCANATTASFVPVLALFVDGDWNDDSMRVEVGPIF